MTNTENITVGTTFGSSYADGHFTFTVTAIGEIGGEPVALAEMDDPDYGFVVKAFTFNEIARKLVYA